MLASTEYVVEMLHIDRKKFYCFIQCLKKDFINVIKGLLLYLNDDQFNAFPHWFYEYNTFDNYIKKRIKFKRERACKSKPRCLMSQIAVKLHYFTCWIQLSNKQLCSSSIAIIITLQSSGFILSTNARQKLIEGQLICQSQATRTAIRNNSNYNLNQLSQLQFD